MKNRKFLLAGAALLGVTGITMTLALMQPPNSLGVDLLPAQQETVDRAEKGDRVALRQVGLWLADGTIQIGSFEEQQQEARLWLKRAVDFGDADAALKLAYMVNSVNQEEAGKLLELSALGGNLEAQLLLAEEARQDPLGQNPDVQKMAESARWYLAAAEQGDAFAQFVTGINFLNGAGVESDPAVAVEWFGRSARQGETPAQLWLAESFAEGLGVPQDFKLAHVWANIAAGQGDHVAAELRLDLEKRMTSDQVADAQSIASRCLASNFSDCR